MSAHASAPSSEGRLIVFVGPSGVGKDSVMEGVKAARPDLHSVRRVITRAPEAGGEDYIPVTEDEFRRHEAAGAFALSWPAHGLLYGIPKTVAQDLAAGRDVIANLSRAVLPEAQTKFPTLLVIQLTAERAVLAQRLAARGRESAEEIARRLERASFQMPEGVRAHQIDNSGGLEDTVAHVLALLYPALYPSRGNR